MNAPTSNQAMQRTASQAAPYVQRVCHPRAGGGVVASQGSRSLNMVVSLDPLPPLFYDFASCIEDGAADGLCMGKRAGGRYPP